jgi:uracil-DNA glycosylase
VLLQPFHPGVTPATVAPFFAHTNSAKCCEHNPGRAKARSVLFKNCRQFIPEELRILAPDVLVTQGHEARRIVAKDLPLLMHDVREVKGASYEAGIIQLTAAKQALWLHTYHPNNYGLFHPQRKHCWPLYAELVGALAGPLRGREMAR